MNRYPCITGLGFITSIGHGAAAVLDSLRAGRSGLGPFPHTWSDQSPIRVAGTLDGFDTSAEDPAQWSYPDSISLPRNIARSASPQILYSFGALAQALDDAGIDPGEPRLRSAALYAASAGSPMLLHRHLDYLKSTRGRRANPAGVLSSISGTLNFALGAHFGIEGGNCGFVSACTSSAHALGYALEDLRQKRVETAVIVAAEDLTPESLLPFAGMRALSTRPDKYASRPFDQHRDGFVPTGGAVALILELRDRPSGYAWLRDWHHSSDGHDMAISHPEGDGIYRAMRGLAQRSGIQPHDLDYINAHATSTRTGDRSEATGIVRFLGDAHVPVSSTKGITGHGLSMAGAMEAAFSTLMVKHNFIAGNPHLETPDPAAAPLHLPIPSLERPVRRIISNSCGFGGSNVSLLLETS